MKIQPNYINLRKLFWSRVEWQPNKSTISIPTVNSVDDYSDFTGEGNVTYRHYELKCFYNRVISDAVRDKFGIETDVALVLYISPIDWNKLVKQYSLPERLMKIKGLKVTFLGDTYKPAQLNNVEPIIEDDIEKHIAIELRLVKSV